MTDPDLPLFVYGTLRDPDVLTLVLGRKDLPVPVPAHLPDHRAVRYPGRDYPGIVPQADASAPGLLLWGLSPADLRILDAFEGQEYQRRPARVMVNGQAVPAALYWPMASIAADAEGWSLEAWASEHKAGFLEREAETLAGLRRAPG